MKKFICLIVVLLAAVILYSPGIQAQDQADTVWLSVESDMIVVDSTDTWVNPKGNIVFCTVDRYTFTVLINNYDQFIDNPVIYLNFTVSRDNPVTITVGSPPEDDNIKVYSVGTVGKKVPLPPTAPPRIILNQND